MNRRVVYRADRRYESPQKIHFGQPKSNERATTAAPEHPLLTLQRTAGNRAVTQLVVQRSAMTSVADLMKGGQATDTYELGIDADASDIVGHAWIDIKSNSKPDSQKLTVGFWPTWLAISPTGAKGELHCPDNHNKPATSRKSQTISHEQYLKVLNTVNDWEGAYYQILYHNCAHFAKAAWLAGTANPDGIVNESGPTIWTPRKEDANIAAENKARGLDAMGEPNKT
jgi:hypothetical protein